MRNWDMHNWEFELSMLDAETPVIKEQTGMQKSLTLVMAAVLFCQAAQAEDADLVLKNGNIVTVDKSFRVVDAMAVRESRIVAVGKIAAIKSHIGRDTKVVDLGGKMVLPGLIDSHTHPTGASRFESGSCHTEYGINRRRAVVRSTAGAYHSKGRMDQALARCLSQGSGSNASRHGSNWTKPLQTTRFCSALAPMQV